MGRALAAERVRRDVEVLARAGLSLPVFVHEAMASLERAVPFDSVCVGTMDPSTGLLTGHLKVGGLAAVDGHDHEWGLIEYGRSDPTSYLQMAARGVTAAGVRAGTLGDPAGSVRVEEFMRPHFRFSDELRTLCVDERGRAWGGVALFRLEGDPGFDADEVDYLGSLSGSFALGMRSGLMISLAATADSALQGPVVLIVDGANEVVRASLGAEQRLAELIGGTFAAGASALVGCVVGAARRYVDGGPAVFPRARVRAANGLWLVVHASPLNGVDGPSGEVAVTIEEARPPEIVPLVVAAFGLTPRERDITQLVLQGLDTRDIAAQLYLSTYTVQDHLKSVFEKAGVRSRRELIARVYFDQYVPRMNASLAPSGWFLDQAG